MQPNPQPSLPYHLRVARAEEVPTLKALIDDSARALSKGFYSDEETEAAIEYVFGVDSELLSDETYYAIECEGELVACGGWSKRKTLFGGDQYAGRESGLLDPESDPAKIRAFFIHPNHARRGLATMLLQHCEGQAKEHGFKHMEMMSTMPGVPFYAALGYEAIGEAAWFDMPNGIPLEFLQMRKVLI